MTDLRETGEPMVITQNGEAKAVIQDIASYEKDQETLALLKILALGQKDIAEGRYRPFSEAIDDLKAKLAQR